MKKTLSVILAAIILTISFTAMPVSIGSVTVDRSRTGTTSGRTGDCFWLLNGTELTITGSGEMGDYDYDAWGDSVTKVTVGEGVTHIGAYSFYNCEKLSDVKLSATVTTIGENAFYGCILLKSISFPDSVTEIEEYAFFNCANLKSITFPDSVFSVGVCAFHNTGWFEEQPDGVVYADDTVYSCKGSCPTSVVVKDGTLSVADRAFESCEELMSIRFPDSVFKIGEYAFSNCTNLKTVILPDNRLSIGKYAFYECSALKKISIPDSVARIDNGTFYGTGWYNDQPNGVVYAGKIAYGHKGSCPANLVIKDGTTAISGMAFSQCDEIKSVVIPDSVTEVGYSAFYGCTNLSDVSVGKNVAYFGYRSFYNCTSLHSITVPYRMAVVDYHAFGYQHSWIIYSDYDMIDDFTIFGYLDSIVQEYADENGINFQQLFYPPPTVIIAVLGDVDRDFKVTVLDASIIQRYLAHYLVEHPELVEKSGDIDGDGLSILDATMLQRYLAGMPVSYGIGSSIEI